jgi:dTDP-4-amino-4,6-dideoxygalactose transaminase
MSEIVAAVVHEQLKGYPQHLASLRAVVAEFKDFITRFDGMELVLGNAENPSSCAFTQVTLRIDEALLGRSKCEFKTALYDRGIPVWHGNYEPINSLSLFRSGRWADWLPTADVQRTRSNYEASFPHAQRLYDREGLGLGKMNFLSKQNTQHLMRQIEGLCLRAGK